MRAKFDEANDRVYIEHRGKRVMAVKNIGQDYKRLLIQGNVAEIERQVMDDNRKLARAIIAG